MIIKTLKIEQIVSGHSLYAGFDYYSKNKVISVEPLDNDRFKAFVKGNNDEIYEVFLDNKHFKRTTCTCPYCDGHQGRFCKHKVAAYLKVNPKEVSILEDRIYGGLSSRQDEQYQISSKLINAKVELEVDKLVDKMTPAQIKKKYKEVLKDERKAYLLRKLQEAIYEGKYCPELDDVLQIEYEEDE